MATYVYECQDCLAKATDGGRELTKDEYEAEALFETTHPMEPTDEELHEATKCPRCEGNNCMKVFYGSNITCYVRGNGYLDKAGCHRDMNMHKLETDDPYAEYREPGEVDDIKSRLKRAGQHDPKSKHYVVSESSGMQKAVSDAAKTSIKDEE